VPVKEVRPPRLPGTRHVLLPRPPPRFLTSYLGRAAGRWEQAGVKDAAKKIRAAIEFFDKVGWQTVMSLREQARDDGKTVDPHENED
jgi:hypothetical protein